MPVVEGRGNRKDFSCPYHLWRYGLDGRFLFAPAMERSASFDASKCNLPRVAHEEWGGWVFANLSGTAAPLAPSLEGLSARIRDARIDELVTATTLEFDSPWNWKIMVENFMESYHHIGPHAGSLQLFNPAFGTYATDDAGAFSILENPPIEGADSFVVACIFPLTLIAVTESEMPWAVWYEFDRIEQASLPAADSRAVEAGAGGTAGTRRALRRADPSHPPRGHSGVRRRAARLSQPVVRERSAQPSRRRAVAFPSLSAAVLRSRDAVPRTRVVR